MQLSGQHQRGVTLLEAMIAIVIVALGVLGVLGVQLRTLSDTQTSVRRSQAIRLIEDLNERVRSNPLALTEAVLLNYVVDWGTVTFTAPVCAQGCGPGDLALVDIAAWKQLVRSTMPLGDANVFQVTDTTGTNTRAQLGVMISWRENERASDNSNAGAATAENTAYRAPFSVSTVVTNAAGASISCPADRICHLQYLQPTLRCLPYLAGGATNPPAVCP
jgi:type IV pilus assembly protein PilV